ncbi:arylamine N-acetyltransferase family protein [Spirosoma validum]|uniref:Arylamine N-acetyltransferase n=1 Tax=Spirosoma validum TaxID=2771355 RepID=A0A927B0N2_9BACT|nr:arylamine N-acetyltransferase [Spirosoma validum]MBD2753253.1 arylamine N-acetyltransferase [Spirosoma validum]
MNVDAYLERIQYTGQREPTLATLQALHHQHQLTVPIENLDIHNNREIRLLPEALFDKLITQKRGGFCYELNGLFYELLNTLGFDVTRISGCTYETDKGFNPEFDHLAIVARIDGIDWLVDVAFGKRFPLYPIPLRLNQIQEDKSGCYLIAEHDADYMAIRHVNEQGDWEPGYIFTLTPRELSDFADMCRFHQTSSDSFFTRNKMCSLVTPEGRITLTDTALKVTEYGYVTETNVPDSQAFDTFLYNYFGIRLNGMPAMV